jgi:opacity protein-like surface antigen
MKKLLTTAAMLAALATPALAQYAPQDYQPTVRPSAQHKSAARQNGLHAFAMVPGGGAAASSLDDPSLTGGGSIGYNQLSRSY